MYNSFEPGNVLMDNGNGSVDVAVSYNSMGNTVNAMPVSSFVTETRAYAGQLNPTSIALSGTLWNNLH